MTGTQTSTQTGMQAPGRVASVSEIQAALRAVRAGQFADPSTPSAPALDHPPAAAAITPLPAVLLQRSAPAAPSTPGIPPPGGGTGVWLLATHGGSGARCLSAVLPDTRHAGRTWPSPESSWRDQVVLVCRADHRGLTAAQHYARAYRDEELAERLQLLGVIVSADAPGRIPAPLRRLERLLSGAAPILGRVPWEASWRLGPPIVTGEPLPWLAKLEQSLSSAAGVRL